MYHLMSLYALQFSFPEIYYTLAEEADELFWARVTEKIFALEGKRLEHVESKDFFCVHCPNLLIISAGPGY